MGGGGCCGSYTTYHEVATYHKVDRDFYVFTLPSADATIKHWEAAVDAGRSLLWDALSNAMESSASETMEQYGNALDQSERLILNALNQQFELLKQDKETIMQKAQSALENIQRQAEGFSDLQEEILGTEILQKPEEEEEE
jgi:hypothetical protein